ncbi:hypothetical protein EIP91_012129 [Steccherinum ochraceum]|uniref:Nudix hydrolase domain-containing protein n=1 Tax=Steccherinum ochraceum TaxID=92696 RepID=A0A4R0RQK6_9APHY|nr:hypothetical protein EIP91_012129 [Steccherinum ochraceum]
MGLHSCLGAPSADHGQPSHEQAPAPAPVARRRPTLAHPHVDMGPLSSPAIPDGMYFASNFLTGVGMLIIQPATGKVVVVYDPDVEAWFFPKGRKDMGESLTDAALREAYEESGYRVSLMPLPTPTRAPTVPGDSREFPGRRLNTEPIYVSTYFWEKSRHRREPGIYFTFWFVGEIPEDAEHHEDTGMENEKHYITHLLDFDEAASKLDGVNLQVLDVGYQLWQHKVKALSQSVSEAAT